MPDIAPWALACWFLLIFPTGYVCVERWFSASAMSATHTKERQDMSDEQGGLCVGGGTHAGGPDAYAEKLDVESSTPNWWGHMSHNNYND